MVAKRVDVPDLGMVVLQKRRKSRNIRISVGHDGEIRVSLPAWVSYGYALNFAKSKKEWLLTQITKKNAEDGHLIGKYHRLELISDGVVERIRTRLMETSIRVTYPNTYQSTSSEVQDAIKKASIRALRQEAEKLLPMKLEKLAQQNGFSYNKVTVRQMSGRWGSCNQNHDITLNLFLMQLPWELIDYVLMHELVHTKVMDHSDRFWAEFKKHMPEAKQLRKQMQKYRPTLWAYSEIL